MRVRTLAVLLIAVSLAVPALSQTTTATLAGRVTIGTQPAPGVLVTVSSPALQGARSTETSVEGTYTFPALPPGEYRVTFALSGLQTAIRSVHLHVSDVQRVDAQLTPGLSEEITVVPEPVGGTDSPQASSSFRQELVGVLPMGRGILDVALLAPGVHDSGPNGQLTIHGAPSTENLYLVNGAVITEGLRNQPHNLFIEDAILETTLLSTGVSAEFGRFTGGVVNVLTKSGGNEFDGSLRDNVANDRWTGKTPYAAELDHIDEINHEYEGTLGGRIIRDRLWFFAAARSSTRSERRQTAGTNLPYTWRDDEQRFELKATASLGAQQTLVGSYLDVDAREENLAPGQIADLNTLVDVDLPHSLLALHYAAVLPRTVVLEAQYTRKNYDLIGGGTDRTVTGGTPVYDLETGFAYGAQLLCRACGPEYRDNRELALKATLFHASARLGTHSLVAGVSDFQEMAARHGHVTSSDFDLYAGTRVVDGTTYIVVNPGEAVIDWWPVLVPSVGDEFTTRALYVNDRIDVGRRWSFNLGLRYERSIGKDQGGADQAEGSSWSPRLGVAYDLGGDRRHHLSASFSRYAAKIDEFVASAASPAGNPANYVFLYDGPPINTGGELLPLEEVLRQVFDWFESVGGTSNTDYLLGASSPLGLSIEDELRAPVMDEITLGYGREFGRGGSARIDLIRREWHDFYSLRATRETGTIDDMTGGMADRIIIENDDSGLTREYLGAALQGSWQRGPFRMGGSYTLSRLWGNVESDTAARGTVAVQSPVAYYPEYTAYPAFAQKGHLNADERHRGNLWAALRVATPIVDIETSVLQTFHSGRRYAGSGQIDVRPYVQNPGYLQPPNLQTYTFTRRGGLQADDITSTNLGITLSRRIAVAELFVDAEVLNVFDEDGIESPGSLNRTVRTNRTDRNLATFNPFTTTPIECPRGVSTASAECKGIAHYQFAPQFGTPTSRLAYQRPRTFQFSFGARF